MLKTLTVDRKLLVLFNAWVLIAGLVYSPFLLSVSMWIFAVYSLVDFRFGKGKTFLRFDRAAVKRMLRFYRNPPFFAVTLFFFLVVLSVWQTEDWSYWLERVRIKIPFLIFPLMFLALPRFTKREVMGLFYFMLILMLVSCLGVGINYALHFEEINLAIKQGRSMPTPRDHIRFSLLLALSIIGGAYLYLEKFYWKNPSERKWIAGITVFLFLFIHLLSVRSGLVALYLAIVAGTAWYIFQTKKYWLGLAVGLGLAALPVLAWFAIPSFQTKIRYAVYDRYMYNKGEGGLYADSGRIVSLNVGWDIFKANPVLGVGAGNLDREVKKGFAEKYPEYVEPLMPHNQFLFVMAGTGVIGLLIFLYAVFLPFFFQKNFSYPPLLCFYAIFLFTFMIEHTIENAIGVGTFVFFLVLMLSMLNREKET